MDKAEVKIKLESLLKDIQEDSNIPCDDDQCDDEWCNLSKAILNVLKYHYETNGQT